MVVGFMTTYATVPRPKKKDWWFLLTLPGLVSFILPGQLILLAILVEKNIFEASHVTFFNTN
jgi:hypothetical protein